jgi:hypothetical protein
MKLLLDAGADPEAQDMVNLEYELRDLEILCAVKV